VFKDEFNHDDFAKCTFPEDKDNVLICKCGTQYTDIKLVDIDKDKRYIQQQRFKKQRSENFRQITNIFGLIGMNQYGLFDTPNVGIQVVESDAGLEAIEAYERSEKRRIKDEEKAEVLRYKSVGRNDKCLCGSDLKYKKCCEGRISGYK